MLRTTPNPFLERAKAPKLVANADPLTLVVKSKVEVEAVFHDTLCAILSSTN